jgi:5-methylcytosine-specific restriction endonuclease McrA
MVASKGDLTSEEATIDALPGYTLRAPCSSCGELSRGRGPRAVNGQAVVYCATCRRFAYNAPKSETGTPQRRLRSREDLRVGQRERILERDNATCLSCGRRPPEVILHVAHMISVADCIALGGFGSDDYNDDSNLYTACEECNLRQGRRSLPPSHMIRMILLHNRRKRENT